MKYSNRWPLAEILADRLLAQPRVRDLLAQSDIIIPIPLHWKKQFSRGYNQSALLAHRIARSCSLLFADPLARIKNTQSQTAARSKLQRIANLRHAFGLTNSRKIADQRVILIDDVTTSNATLQFAARTITSARPKTISAIVLATADQKRSDFTAI
jgi:ComF family protein